jgi:AcrR family transcriptional regulator
MTSRRASAAAKNEAPDRASVSEGTDAARPLSLREDQKRRTRQKLIDSAQKVFHQRGYSHATVSEIVAGAGASQGTFYLYFPTKASVLVQLMNEGWVAELADRLAALGDIADGSVEDYREWVSGFMSLYGRHARTLRAWAQAAGEEHDVLRQTDVYINSMIDGVCDAIQARKRPATTAEKARLVAMTLIFELERVCFFKYVRGWSIDDDIEEVLSKRWHAAIAGA